MLIVDTHVHASPYWYEPVETLLHQMNVNNVGKAVLTQINGHYHNDYLFECAHRYPGRFAMCVVVDTSKEDAPAKMEECAKRGATGVRLQVKTRSAGGDKLALWRKADELRLAVSVLGTAEEFATEEFRKLVETFPNLSIVIEHFGRPGADERPPYPVYRRVLALANYPNTYMKLGGLGELCEKPKVVPQSYPFSDIPPFVKMAVDAFGPRRLMFGSDYPPVGRREGYRNALFGLMDHLSYLKREELEWVFGQTALSVWNFPDERVP